MRLQKEKGKKSQHLTNYSRLLKPEKRRQLEILLLERLKLRKGDLEKMLAAMSGHWTYEDHFYRYYHGSFKVYSTQNTNGAGR